MKGRLDAGTPQDYFDSLDEPRKGELLRLHKLIREIAPDLEPHMRSGIVGYGTYRYKYDSGREGEWFRLGLASNKNYISLYCCATDGEGYVAERFKSRLPKASIGKSCVRFKRVNDLDESVLRELIQESATSQLWN